MSEQQSETVSGRFRKKPVVIDAFHMLDYDDDTVQSFHEWLDTLSAAFDAHFVWTVKSDGSLPVRLRVKTMEGTSYDVPVGYWIIRGVKGEFYPCDPEVFDETYVYEQAAEEGPQKQMTAIEKEKEDIIVNGKVYPMWQQFAQQTEEWVGGELEDLGDSFDNLLSGGETMTTQITGIELRPNGDDSAFFEIKGKEFDCGFDVKYGGIVAGEDGWFTFSGYGGHEFRINKPRNT